MQKPYSLNLKYLRILSNLKAKKHGFTVFWSYFLPLFQKDAFHMGFILQLIIKINILLINIINFRILICLCNNLKIIKIILFL